MPSVSPALDYRPEPSWPPLAWIARCVAGQDAIRIRHGRQVETRPEWFCEAIWDDDFRSGDFDQTDIAFGSGARCRDAQVTFVSSASTVDRLHVLRRRNEVLISNSLPCLLAVANVAIPPGAENWLELFVSIKHGIDKYRKDLPTTAGERIELVYYRNLRWTGSELLEVEKPPKSRDFSTFDRYFDFLLDSVRRLSLNLSDASRRHPYQMLGTLSSGYDSSTATVICHRFGLERAIASRQARGDGGADDGQVLGHTLGIQVDLFDRNAWSGRPYAEVPFFAGNPRGGEVFMASNGDHLAGKVLVTGFHGDKVWGKATTALGPDLVRGDMSGLSLCEYRLQVGFIHFPLPFLGVRQIRDIHALSNSDELRPWDVPGDYSRPICRRIVEDAGVPREAFGQRKKMTSVHFGQGEVQMTTAARHDYFDWLERTWKAGEFASIHRCPAPSRFTVFLRDRFWALQKAVQTLSQPLPAAARRSIGHRMTRLQRELTRRINVPEFVFPWAVERLCEAYRPRQDHHAIADAGS